jgi:quercetin dioxygenase-like cupin family protein
MPIYIEEEKETKAIVYIMLIVIAMVIAGVGISILDREPIKERKQVVLIKSIGVWHQYTVDGKNVIVTYQESK